MAPKNVLIMVTGSVAAIKLPNLIRALKNDKENEYHVKVALTERSLTFFSLLEVQKLLPEPILEIPDEPESEPQSDVTIPTSPDKSYNYRSPFDDPGFQAKKSKNIHEKLDRKTIFRDTDEWSNWSIMGDPVLHIVLRNWADIGLIAPLDANTLGKMTSGQCDNLITCIIRAWDIKKPLIYAPAMNVNMWTHPLTDRCLKVCDELGYIRVGPISKKLACGDTGIGAMEEVEKIVEELNKHSQQLPQP